MPKDLPLPIADDNGSFLPSTAESPSQSGKDGIRGYDPWIHANLAKQTDQSQPEIGPYGENQYALAGSINADWGGMPSPTKAFQEPGAAVLLVRRPIKDFSGPTGQFYGPAQTAWEAQQQPVTTDYWSTLLMGG